MRIGRGLANWLDRKVARRSSLPVAVFVFVCQCVSVSANPEPKSCNGLRAAVDALIKKENPQITPNNYDPAGQRIVVRSDSVRAYQMGAIDELESFGFKVSQPVDRYDAILRRDFGNSSVDVLPGTNGQRFLGHVFRIEKFGKPTAIGQWDTFAPLHPEFQSEVIRLRAKGEDVMFDPTMISAGYHAYYRYGEFVAVGPTTTWAMFKHEMQHFDFHNTIRPFYPAMIAIQADRKRLLAKLPADAVDAIGADRVRAIQKLLDKGITPELAINESLSLDTELKAMGWARFSPEGSNARKYRLMHQITEIEGLGDVQTQQQRAYVARAKIKHDLLAKDTAKNRERALEVMKDTAVGAALIGSVYVAYSNDDGRFQKWFSKYAHLLFDKKGHVIGVKPDGNVDVFMPELRR